MNCTTAAEMWKRLVNQYEQHAAENKHLLQQQFFEYCYQKGNDIMTHITAIETLATRLKDLGVTVDDNKIITKIVCTLPPSFRFAISIWDNVPSADKTISLLTSRLLKEETMNKVYGGQEEADSAFLAKGVTTRMKSREPLNRKVCFPDNEVEEEEAPLGIGEIVIVMGVVDMVTCEEIAMEEQDRFENKKSKLGQLVR